MRTGFQNNILKHLKISSQTFPENVKHCVLIHDEIALKAGFEYTPYLDLIEGYEDYGETDPKMTTKPAKSALVFMIRGIIENYKLPVAYVFSSSSTKGELVAELVEKCIRTLANCGFYIHAVVCDQGTTNQKACKLLNVTEDKPFFYVDGQKVFFIYDIVHIIKNIRNRFKETPFIVNEKKVSWQDVVDAYTIDKTFQRSRCLDHLSDSHLKPNSFQAMNAGLAIQIFSHKTATGIKTMSDRGDLISDSAQATAEFLFKINDIFDALNIKNQLSSNPLAMAISETNEKPLEVLQSAQKYISTWRVDKPEGSRIAVKPNCFSGLLQTVTAVLQLWDALKGGVLQFLLTGRLNQDPLENCFSEIRGRGGFNMFPTCRQFRVNLENIICQRISAQWASGNSQYEDIPNLITEDELIAEEEDLATPNNDFDDWEDDTLEEPSATEMCAISYFAGYISYATNKKFNCERCQNYHFKDASLACLSDSLILNRQFDYISKPFILPSDTISQKIETLLSTFAEVYPSLQNKCNIRKSLITVAEARIANEFSDWLSTTDNCYLHRKFMIEKLFTIKLHNTAKLQTRELQNNTRGLNAKNKHSNKLRILKNS